MISLNPPTGREMDDIFRSAPKDADANISVAWLRRSIASIALMEAALLALGEETDNPPYTETLMLAGSMAERLGWPAEWAHAALAAEWKAARNTANPAVEAAEKAARRLIFERAPGDRVLEAARAPIERAGIDLPQQSIIALCRRVAQGRGHGAKRVGTR